MILCMTGTVGLSWQLHWGAVVATGLILWKHCFMILKLNCWMSSVCVLALAHFYEPLICDNVWQWGISYHLIPDLKLCIWSTHMDDWCLVTSLVVFIFVKVGACGCLLYWILILLYSLLVYFVTWDASHSSLVDTSGPPLPLLISPNVSNSSFTISTMSK